MFIPVLTEIPSALYAAWFRDSCLLRLSRAHITNIPFLHMEIKEFVNSYPFIEFTNLV